MELFLLQTALTLVIAGGAAFLGAYLATKGKNLARKEDLNALVAEVRAVTVAQKEIEAKISGEVWERQRRYQEKLQVYARVIDAGWQTMEQHLALSLLSEGPDLEAERLRVHNHLLRLHEELQRAIALGTIVLDDSAAPVLGEVLKASQHPDHHLNAERIAHALDEVTRHARRELGRDSHPA